MKRISVSIKGISPLLMHRFPLEPVEAIEKKTPAEQAEISVYRMAKSKNLYIPGVAMQRALVVAATFSKGKGRSSLQKAVAAGVYVLEECLDLNKNEYTVDSRAVVVPATKGRVVRHRPRLDEWGVSFTVEYDETLLTETQLRRIIDDCGSRVGLLDFRPEKKGSCGRFIVTEWK